MKFVKGISLFFIYPAVFLIIGIFCGVWGMSYFYPGAVGEPEHAVEYQREVIQETPTAENEESVFEANRDNVSGQNVAAQVQQVSAVEETLNADTEYVVQERDLLRQTVVETVWQIPGKYIGMDRELFVESMEEYQKNPPLSEVERGFVGLEIISFSPERVVVQMNYEYVQPSESFYLIVQDNEVVVLLEDMETVFINTGIRLEELPEIVQMKIMQMYWIEDEESLYNFLETYSS